MTFERSASPFRASVRFSRLLAATTALLLPSMVWAQATTALPSVDVTSQSGVHTLGSAPLTTTALSRDQIRGGQARTSDTARLLQSVPGVSANGGGGFSSMPAIRGLNEQRLNIRIDGVTIDAACPNDMNPPLSYTDPQTVRSIRVITGVSPVSMGGDSIGGVIAVETAVPQFAPAGERLLKGEASTFYRSNGDGFGGALTLITASDRLNLTYNGSYTQSGNHDAGGDRGVVRSTEYAKTDHTLALALQTDAGLFELKGGYHFSPYEGFPNQYMDMTSNRSWFANGRYRGMFDWGDVDLRVHYRDTDHAMNFLDDKGGTATGGMPMNTEVHTAGYELQFELPLSSRGTLRIGSEFHHQWLDDYWPPVAGNMMMGPRTFINVNGARRDRLGTFAEWEARWGEGFSTLIGVRHDQVWMNTGDVQSYSTGMMSMADNAAAAAFNAVSHRRRDGNISATAMLGYKPNDRIALELGYAHKVRSPNIYERYSWGRGNMASRMIGWFGDGNGYVGNLALEPERADTVSAAAEISGGGKDRWSLKIAPYYTRVSDYIDAAKIGDLTDMMGRPSGFVQLRFENQNAEFYGVDISGSAPLWSSDTAGSARLSASASWLRGRNLTDGGPLYHQMPLTVRAAVEHRLGGLQSAIDVEWVTRKKRVDVTRNEPRSAGYALVNARTSYDWGRFTLKLDVENLFDKGYDLPLGGMSLGDYKATGALRPVPGRGRSLNLGLGVRI